MRGYENHMGQSSSPGLDRPWFRLGGRGEGAVSRDGRVRGSYLHGLFGADGFRAAFLAGLGIASDLLAEGQGQDSLRYALLLCSLFNLWAAVHFFLAGRALPAELDAQAAEEALAAQAR